jgi:hypothetical protein
MKKYCAVTLLIKHDCSIASRSPFVAPRDSLLDQEFAEPCIDQSLVGTINGIAKHRIVDTLFACEPSELPRLVNLHQIPSVLEIFIRKVAGTKYWLI